MLLKTEHKDLYRRIRTKLVVQLLLAVDLLVFPGLTVSFVNLPFISYLFTATDLGIVFLFLSLLCVYSLFQKKSSYKVARFALSVSAFYSTVFSISLGLESIHTPKTIPLAILFAYFVRTMFNVVSDPAWITVDTIETTQEKNG